MMKRMTKHTGGPFSSPPLESQRPQNISPSTPPKFILILLRQLCTWQISPATYPLASLRAVTDKYSYILSLIARILQCFVVLLFLYLACVVRYLPLHSRCAATVMKQPRVREVIEAIQDFQYNPDWCRSETCLKSMESVLVIPRPRLETGQILDILSFPLQALGLVSERTIEIINPMPYPRVLSLEWYVKLGFGRWHSYNKYWAMLLESIRDHAPPGSMVWINLRDEDFFFEFRKGNLGFVDFDADKSAKIESSGASYKKRMMYKAKAEEFVQKFPDVFFVHQNPTLRNTVEGALWPRSIPIPDQTAVPLCRNSGQSESAATIRAALEKKKPGVVWRGGPLGTPVNVPRYCNTTDRFRVVTAFAASQQCNENEEKSTSSVNEISSTIDKHIKPICNVYFSRGSPWYFGNGLYPCTVEEYERALRKTGKAAVNTADSVTFPALTQAEMASYRVILDVDGNANSWEGLRWKLHSGSAVIKVDPQRFVQWYYHRMQAGVHFHHVNPDDPNLVEQTLDVALNVTYAASLAFNGQKFSMSQLSCDAIFADMRAIFAVDWKKEYGKGTERDWRWRSQKY